MWVTDMAEPYHTTRLIEFADTDMAGIVHFASFFHFMEAAEHAFLRSRGLSVVMKWEGQSISFPRVSASCDFQRPARFEDVLDIAVTIARLGKTSIAYAFDFTLDGKPIARGQIATVCCRVHEGHRFESLEIPEGIRKKLTE